MAIYICSVCGFDYDEAAGDPKSGIKPGTRWEDVPDDWVCPICGADKSMFERAGEQEKAPQTPAAQPAAAPAAGETSMKRLAIMASNLARGAGKQYRQAASDALTALADYYEGQSRPEGGFEEAARLLEADIAAYPAAFEAAHGAKDRGALRALTWGEKVSKIQSAVMARFRKDGDQAFENSNFYVCDACGFIYFGERAPDLCPVCKVPAFKFNEIKKGA